MCGRALPPLHWAGPLVDQPQLHPYIPGAATAISLLTPENFSKFLLNLPARSSAARSYAALSAHIPRASRNVAGTPGHDFGTLTPNTGCRSTAISFNQPLSAAFSMARVYPSFMRSPPPNGPPAHPVFTSQHCAPV